MKLGFWLRVDVFFVPIRPLVDISKDLFPDSFGFEWSFKRANETTKSGVQLKVLSHFGILFNL
jgi:hypothetical protein